MFATLYENFRAMSEAIARRTPVTQDEVNSWFMYRAQPVLPTGVSQPQLRIVGQVYRRLGEKIDLRPPPLAPRHQRARSCR